MSGKKCYAASLGDCKGKINLEHWFSKNILEQIQTGKNIKIGGLHWIKGEGQVVSAETLASNVLCEKHNSALSSLDAYAGELFTVLRRFHRKEQIGLVQIDGHALEKWMMKALFGMIASGNANPIDGKPTKGRRPLDSHLRILFGSDPLPPGTGLRYFNSPKGVWQKNQIEAVIINAPIVNGPAHPVTIGFKVSLLGFNLFASLNQTHNFDVPTFYRPRRFRFNSGDTELGVLELLWSDPSLQKEIILQGEMKLPG